MPRIITHRKGLPTLRSRILQVLVAAQTPLTARTIGQRCGLSYKAVNKSLSTMVPQKLVNMRGFYNVNGQKVPAMYWVSEASNAAPAPAPAPNPNPRRQADRCQGLHRAGPESRRPDPHRSSRDL